jgi:hypothetical protein
LNGDWSQDNCENLDFDYRGFKPLQDVSLEIKKKMGKLIETGNTETIFTCPPLEQTEDFNTGP